MSIPFSFSLFYLSFLPLWVSIVFVNVKSIWQQNENLMTEYISVPCIVILFFLSLGIVFGKFRELKKEDGDNHTLLKVREEKSITAEYLLAYILPLSAFDFTKWNEMILFLLLIIPLVCLNIRHHCFSVNIVLEIVKYRFYECELENEDGVIVSKIVISNRMLRLCKGGNIKLKSINNEYKLDVTG